MRALWKERSRSNMRDRSCKTTHKQHTQRVFLGIGSLQTSYRNTWLPKRDNYSMVPGCIYNADLSRLLHVNDDYLRLPKSKSHA
jgi:hypothetical protein